jgi:hypothetical protein
VHTPAVVAVADELGELVRERLGAELHEGSVVALGQDPPARLALLAVLAHE